MPRVLLRALRPTQWVKNLFVLAPVLFGKVAGRPDLTGRTVAVAAAFCAAGLGALPPERRSGRRGGPTASRQEAPPRRFGLAPAGGGARRGSRPRPGRAPRRTSRGSGRASRDARVRGRDGPLLARPQEGRAPGRLHRRVRIRPARSRGLRGGAGRAVALAPPLHVLPRPLPRAQQEAERARRARERGRASLREVPVGLLEAFENIALGTTIVCYALYTVAPETIAWFRTDRLLATVPIVLFGLFRWRLIEARGGGEDATSDLFTDAGLLATVVIWGTVCAVLIYGPGRG